MSDKGFVDPLGYGEDYDPGVTVVDQDIPNDVVFADFSDDPFGMEPTFGDLGNLPQNKPKDTYEFTKTAVAYPLPPQDNGVISTIMNWFGGEDKQQQGFDTFNDTYLPELKAAMGEGNYEEDDRGVVWATTAEGSKNAADYQEAFKAGLRRDQNLKNALGLSDEVAAQRDNKGAMSSYEKFMMFFMIANLGFQYWSQREDRKYAEETFNKQREAEKEDLLWRRDVLNASSGGGGGGGGGSSSGGVRSGVQII